MNETIHDRITQLVKTFGNGKNTVFASLIGVSEANLRGYRNNVIPKYDFLEKIARNFDINLKWLLTGEGEMLRNTEKGASEEEPKKERHLIPFYDVTAIGGRQYDADMAPAAAAPEMIDTGDWFNDATAAMRVQGDSMSPEYKSGSIVALKQIVDKRVIMYGEDYVVETDEFRVIKRIQRSDNPQCLLACSTNSEQWESGPLKGRLIHEPFEIPKDAIRRMFLVLGEVRRNHSCNIVNVIK